MKHSRIGLFFVSLLAAAGSVALILNAIAHGSGTTQDGASSLLIERHGNEPLELVDLKIRERSVRSGIRTKFRNGQDGYDKVSFPNSEEWSKSVRVRLRNVSGKRIVGFEAYLYFRPVGADMYFSANLKAAGRLEHTALNAGEEIEAKVDEDAWNRARMRVWRYGANFDSAGVVLSLGIVAFDDGLEWHKGHTLRVDPDNPQRHTPVESKTPLDLGDLGSRLQTRFQSIAFAPRDRTLGKSAASILNPEPAQIMTRCVNDNGSLDAPHCLDDPNSENCFTLNFLPPSSNGTKTRFPVSGDCRVIPGPVDRGIVCTAETTHQIFFTDPDCNPTPTPTISCLPEGAVFTEGLLPCCPNLTVVDGICTAPGPTPNPCAGATPPTCSPGNSPVFVGPPLCFICAPDFFPTPLSSPSPSPSPSCGRLLDGCFVTRCCAPLICNGVFCVMPGSTPSPSPTPPPECGDCSVGCCDGDICGDLSGACIPCVPDWRERGGCTSESCQLCYELGGVSCTGGCWTPIVIDVLGNGFALTDAANGVNFDDGSGNLLRTAWTEGGADDAWLALDRNGNGTIDDARELFGSAAPQPPPLVGDIKNGFRALAEYDKPQNGGNANGIIEDHDAIFSSLRLWQDANHNGISEPGELHVLLAFDVNAISLDYRESRRKDRWGNTFRYRAKVYGMNGVRLGRWAHDVFLQAAPVQAGSAPTIARLPSTDIRRLLGLDQLSESLINPPWRRQR